MFLMGFKVKVYRSANWVNIIHTYSYSPIHLCVEHVQFSMAQVINGL